MITGREADSSLKLPIEGLSPGLKEVKEVPESHERTRAVEVILRTQLGPHTL